MKTNLIVLLTISAILSSCAKKEMMAAELMLVADCKVTYDKPGTYVLENDIVAEKCAIGITASDVKLDLNGHTLTGPKSMSGLSYGVMAIDRSRVEVYNGKIEGFMFGVSITGFYGRGDDVRDNKVHNLEVNNSSFRGIAVDGYNASVINNKVSNTGGTSFYDDSYGIGIETKGPSCVVNDNIVTDTYGGTTPGLIIAEGVAISFTHYSTYCVAERNQIENSKTVTDKSTFGFWVDVYSQVTLKENRIRNMHYSAIVPPFTIEVNPDYDIPSANGCFDRN